MDCKYVRESNCICYKFHPQGSSLFLLTHFKNRLRIVQQNLLTGLVMNEFIVPLKQQNLDVENYILNFSQQLKTIVLTLYNHLLIYSLERKTLIFVAELHGKNPYYIEKACIHKKTLYFTAVDQHNIYSINLQSTLQLKKISNYSKYKLPQESLVIDILVANNKLIGLGIDKTIKVWDINTCNLMKGANLTQFGHFTCMSLSKNDQYLLVATQDGYILAFDAPKLGYQTILLMKQRLIKAQIRSISWFHYSGQDQSKRFLIMTSQGSVKLFSFYFQQQKNNRILMGKANQLALLYQRKSQINKQYTISSHNFANFIFFNPGVLLFMVDNYPRIYYPLIAKQLVRSFDQLIPNKKKEVFFQRDYLFIEGLQIKRLLNDVQPRVQLSSVLDYKDLKIIKFDYRPQTTQFVEKSKILITYYLKNMIRSIVLSNINLSVMTQNVQNLKQYTGLSVSFIGPCTSHYPLILILQNDKQTISLIQQQQVPLPYLQKLDPQQRKHLSLGGRAISSLKLKIKVQKLYQTPFRNSYVVLYLSQNLLRFSRNIDCQNDILDYQVYPGISLRLDYDDIILDVIWTKGAQFAVVVCLDKLVFITTELKPIRTVNIQYIVQAQWVGFTLIVTTKVDVQYVDIYTKPVQLYCIQNFQSKYLILAILCDRVLSIERFQNSYNYKSRYFNLMQPLLSGYLAYHKWSSTPIDTTKCKHLIQCLAPYHIVSQPFIKLLNQTKLTSFSKYFIQTNMKLYSKSIRSNTFNSLLKMQRFMSSQIWNRHKIQILQLFLIYQQTSNTSDPFQKQKNQQSKDKLINIISEVSFKSVISVMKDQAKSGGVMISNNFGEKPLTQVYFDNKDQILPMEIIPFKAQNIGEWIGLFSTYIQAKVGTVQGVQPVLQLNNQAQQEDQQQKPFKDLIAYYRFDEGKGDSVEDLGDYANNADINGQWIPLEEDPMELQDKWGKKCPAQFSIIGTVSRQKKLSCKKFQNFTIQTWFKFTQQYFVLYKIGSWLHLSVQNNILVLNGKVLSYINNSPPQIFMNFWNHICVRYNNSQKRLQIFINIKLSISLNISLNVTKDSPFIGDEEKLIQFTQFRYWKKILQLDDIKDCMRSPLELVYQKRKKLKMKIKKKKKETQDNNADNFFSFPL